MPRQRGIQLAFTNNSRISILIWVKKYYQPMYDLFILKKYTLFSENYIGAVESIK